jgi:chlorophyll synthase
MEQSLVTETTHSSEKPTYLARSVTLMKPVTWFAPMWAFLCGAIASGATGWNPEDVARVLLGMMMAGPILCGASQVLNDYFDREVDALNEPNRLIPSGMVSVRQVMLTVLFLISIGSGISLYLGHYVLLLTGAGLLFALAYSAPPIRAKRNGWAGNTLVAISYEGLAWLAGHVAFGALTPASLIIAAIYSLGAHGIMSINDYKSIDGDKLSGIYTIPVLHGPQHAAWIIVLTMNLAQLGVIAAFLAWGQYIAAAAIFGILLVQLPVQRTFLQRPMETYLKFSAIGVSFFVWGMMAAAIGLRAL